MKRITILIPTINRSQFVIRALKFYHRTGFQGTVFIGDSSNPQHAAKIKEAIALLKNELDIIYRHYPSPPYINDAFCIHDMMKEVTTPFTVFGGDDDFLIPSSLAKCADFLAANPQYASVHGKRIQVRLEPDEPQGEIKSTTMPPELVMENEDAGGRWLSYMRYAISPQYYVQHTSAWKRMYRDVKKLPVRYIGPELLTCSLSVIQGKIKELDCLSAVFQIQQNRVFSFETHSIYSLMLNPSWSQSLARFRTAIVEALREKGSRVGEDLVDAETWRHLAINLQAHYRKNFHQLFDSQTNLRSNPEFKQELDDFLPIQGNESEPLFYQMCKPGWSAAAQFRDRMVEKWTKKTANGELWLRMIVAMNSQYNQRFPNALPIGTKLKQEQSPEQIEKNEACKDVLTPGTPFYEDFKPVHQAFTNASGGQNPFYKKGSGLPKIFD